MENCLPSQFKRNKSIEHPLVHRNKIKALGCKFDGCPVLSDTLDQKLNEELDKISFHNVDTVTGLYNTVLLCEFPKNKISELSDFVNIRHDIVHRNGKSTDGSLVVVSQLDVIELIELVQYVIKYIDSQIVDGLLGDSDESISKD